MSKKITNKELTPKQHAFALNYLKDFNGTRAYREVYDASTKVAETNASRLLSNAKVAKFVARWALQKFWELGIDSWWILECTKEIIERCMQRERVMVFDKINKEYVQKTVEMQDEEWNRKEVWLYQFDSRGALKWLEMLGKHYCTFIDQLQISWKDGWPIEVVDVSKMSMKELEEYRKKVLDS